MKLLLIQQNVCGRKMYNGNWSKKDFEDLIGQLKNKKPDIIFLTEFYYQQMYNLTQSQFNGYEFIKPILLSKKDETEKRLYASCVLAIKRNKVTKVKQFELDKMLDLRYICVELKIENRNVIKLLMMYIPQTYRFPNRIETKRKMICSANTFVTNNCSTLLFVGGDMNSDIDGKTTSCIKEFEEIYSQMIDTDCKKKNTWNGKRLDYALVTGITNNNSVKTNLIDTNSDHKGLMTVFKF